MTRILTTAFFLAGGLLGFAGLSWLFGAFNAGSEDWRNWVASYLTMFPAMLVVLWLWSADRKRGQE